MKKILGLTISVLVCFVVNAQDKKDSSVKKTAASICNCLEKNHMENAKDQSEMQQIFLQCMLDSAASVMGEVILNSESGDYKQAGEEFAQKIAIELVNSGCKPFMQMSLKLAQGGSLGELNKEDASLKSSDGIVTKVEEKDFLYITVKTSAGREIILVYLDYVDGSDDWVKDAQNKLKDKKVAVKWTEEEVYQPKIKDFTNVKLLKELRIYKQ
jgi:hypothetical protein